MKRPGFSASIRLRYTAERKSSSLHRSQIFRGFVSDAGSGSGILRLRQTIPLLFWILRISLRLESRSSANRRCPRNVSWVVRRRSRGSATLLRDSVPLAKFQVNFQDVDQLFACQSSKRRGNIPLQNLVNLVADRCRVTVGVRGPLRCDPVKLKLGVSQGDVWVEPLSRTATPRVISPTWSRSARPQR